MGHDLSEENRRLSRELDDLKRAYDALAEEARVYRDIYEFSPDFCITANITTGEILTCNHSVAHATGYTKEELVGMNVLALYPEEEHARLLTTFSTVVEGEELRDVEFEGLRKDGSCFTMSLSVTPVFDADGKVVAGRGVVRDISERKETERAVARSEEQFRRMAEFVHMVPWQADPVTRTLSYVGPQVEGIFGYPHDAWFRPDFWSEHLHPDDRVRTVAFAEEKLRAHQSFDYEYRFITAYGRTIWIQDTITVLFRDGEITYLAGMMMDITARKHAEEMQQRLVYELDHRVKNALANVQAVADHTARTARSLPAFTESFRGRLSAMAQIHDALSNNQWKGFDVARLVDLAIAPLAGMTGRILPRGGSAELSLEATRSLGMVLHELTTNASKYGALSGETGTVEIRWEVADDKGIARLHLDWIERGGPTVVAPGGRGFGLRLIEESIPFELGGTVSLSFPAEGVRCRLEIPISTDG